MCAKKFQDQGIYEVVSIIAEYDIQGLLVKSSMLVGLLIIFVTLCTFCIVCKNCSYLKCLYGLTITSIVLYFIAVGILLVTTAAALEDGIDDACNGGASHLALIFRELYSTADTMY